MTVRRQGCLQGLVSTNMTGKFASNLIPFVAFPGFAVCVDSVSNAAWQVASSQKLRGLSTAGGVGTTPMFVSSALTLGVRDHLYRWRFFAGMPQCCSDGCGSFRQFVQTCAKFGECPINGCSPSRRTDGILRSRLNCNQTAAL